MGSTLFYEQLNFLITNLFYFIVFIFHRSFSPLLSSSPLRTGPNATCHPDRKEKKLPSRSLCRCCMYRNITVSFSFFPSPAVCRPNPPLRPSVHVETAAFLSSSISSSAIIGEGASGSTREGGGGRGEGRPPFEIGGGREVVVVVVAAIRVWRSCQRSPSLLTCSDLLDGGVASVGSPNSLHLTWIPLVPSYNAHFDAAALLPFQMIGHDPCHAAHRTGQADDRQMKAAKSGAIGQR